MNKYLLGFSLFISYVVGVLVFYVGLTLKGITDNVAFGLSHIITIATIYLLMKNRISKIEWNTPIRFWTPILLSLLLWGLLILVFHPQLTRNPYHFSLGHITLVMLVAPICEEYFFRHLLSKVISDASGFIIFSTVLFVIFHTPLHWLSILSPLVLSLINGPLYLKNKSFHQIVLNHSLINLLILICI